MFKGVKQYLIKIFKNSKTIMVIMENNKHNEKTVDRALNVIMEKPEWVEYLKKYQHSFMLSCDPTIHTIMDAINTDYDIHSVSSLALCLQQCRQKLLSTSQQQ